MVKPCCIIILIIKSGENIHFVSIIFLLNSPLLKTLMGGHVDRVCGHTHLASAWPSLSVDGVPKSHGIGANSLSTVLSVLGKTNVSI